MRVTYESLELPAGSGPPLGALVVAPAGRATAPGLLFYADIFGRTPPSVRMMARFAGHGFTVVAPDLYRRREPAGIALDFTDDYDRAQRDAGATSAADFDADRVIALAAIRAHPRVASGPLSATGFCIGGHLALRAAVEADVRTIVAFYPTGVHDGSLGASREVGTLSQMAGSSARLLLAFGANDPHVGAAARARIGAALGPESASRRVALYDGAHAFMRDEGPRYDPASTDAAFAAALAWLYGEADTSSPRSPSL